MSRTAVRNPLAADAGAVTALLISRATRPPRCAQCSSRRSTSRGSRQTSAATPIATAPKIAGTTVKPNGADPGNRPMRRPSPSTISASM